MTDAAALASAINVRLLDFSDLNFVPSPTLFPNQLPTTSLLVAALSKTSWSQGLANQPGSIFLLLHPHTRPLGTRRKRKLGRPSRTDHYYSPYYSLFLAFSIAPLPSASPCIYARHIRYRPEEAIHTHSLSPSRISQDFSLLLLSGPSRRTHASKGGRRMGQARKADSEMVFEYLIFWLHSLHFPGTIWHI